MFIKLLYIIVKNEKKQNYGNVWGIIKYCFCNA